MNYGNESGGIPCFGSDSRGLVPEPLSPSKHVLPGLRDLILEEQEDHPVQIRPELGHEVPPPIQVVVQDPLANVEHLIPAWSHPLHPEHGPLDRDLLEVQPLHLDPVVVPWALGGVGAEFLAFLAQSNPCQLLLP